MSYGPNLVKLYQQAGKMAAEFLKTGKVPAVYDTQDDSDFELVVNGTTAKNLSMWPLPGPIAAKAEVIP
jgi:hypothetical protein